MAKFPRSAILGSVLVFLLGLVMLALGAITEYIYQKDAKDNCIPGKCEKRVECSIGETPKWLLIALTSASFVAAVAGTAFGSCPCCVHVDGYKKGVSFCVSITMLVLLWLAFVYTVVFGVLILLGMNVALDEANDPCLRVGKYATVSVGVSGFLLGLFSAAHILLAGFSWKKGQAARVVPVAVPIAPIPTAPVVV